MPTKKIICDVISFVKRITFNYNRRLLRVSSSTKLIKTMKSNKLSVTF